MRSKYKEFPWDKYIPIENGEDEYLLETYGEDLEKVRNTPNKNLWTILTGVGKDDLIVAGYHFVNRLNYVVTKNKWINEDETYLWR